MKRILKSMALAGAMLLGAGAAQAGVDNGTFTNSITVISNSVNTTAISQALTIHPGCALAISPRFNGTGNTNVIVGLDLYNGTSWSTTAPLQSTNACNFGTNVVGYTVFSAAQLAGASQVRWDYTSTTHATNVVMTGVDYQMIW